MKTQLATLVHSVKKWFAGFNYTEPDTLGTFILEATRSTPTPTPSPLEQRIKALEETVAEQSKIIETASRVVGEAQHAMLLNEIERLRRELNNAKLQIATLSGAYMWVAIEDEAGRKNLHRFNMN